MASIKRRKDSAIWVACFTLPNGKRKQVSTHTTNEHEAQQIALSYEKAGAWAKSKRLTDSSARRVVREITAAAGYADAFSDLTVRAFLQPHIDSLAVRLKNPRTLERYKYALEHFRDDSGLGERPLASIKRSDGIDWREHLSGEGLAPTTVNHQLGVIRAAFAEALDRELIESNPFEGVRIKKAKRAAQKRQPFTFEQFSALLAALELADCTAECPDEWRRLVLVAGYTGQRKSDCVALRAGAVNLQRGVIGFWRSKNADSHEVPIHPALARELAPVVAKLAADDPLFPNLAALPKRGRASISDQFRQTILPLIGIDQPYAKSGGSMQRRLAKLSFHSLRHALSSWLNAAGVSDVDRMALVGHDDRDVSKGYTHAGLEQAKRAIALLPEPTRPCETSEATPPCPQPTPAGTPSSPSVQVV